MIHLIHLDFRKILLYALGKSLGKLEKIELNTRNKELSMLVLKGKILGGIGATSRVPQRVSYLTLCIHDLGTKWEEWPAEVF